MKEDYTTVDRGTPMDCGDQVRDKQTWGRQAAWPALAADYKKTGDCVAQAHNSQEAARQKHSPAWTADSNSAGRVHKAHPADLPGAPASAAPAVPVAPAASQHMDTAEGAVAPVVAAVRRFSLASLFTENWCLLYVRSGLKASRKLIRASSCALLWQNKRHLPAVP